MVGRQAGCGTTDALHDGGLDGETGAEGHGHRRRLVGFRILQQLFEHKKNGGGMKS